MKVLVSRNQSMIWCQAARQWYKMFIKILHEITFQGGYADPCLMVKHSKENIVLHALYMDNSLCIGFKEAYNTVIKQHQEKGLTMKFDENLKDYISCQILIIRRQEKSLAGPASFYQET